MTAREPEWRFESLRTRLEEVHQPTAPGERETLWVVDRVLGIARSHLGAVEIFLVGPRLHPRTGTVRRHLEHGQWETSSGDVLEASRIVLPSEHHFVAISALIGIEMVRAGLGAGEPAQAVLDSVEPIIELALRRGALSEESVVGLLGELLALEQMLLAVLDEPTYHSAVLDMWRGHQRGERDFVIGATGVEVKTTRHETATHRIQSLHQVEPAEGEDALFLLSVGLRPTASDGQSLPEAVDRLLGLLGEWPRDGPPSPIQQRLLRDVEAYGASATTGYDHLTMVGWSAYQVAYRLTFSPRLYDLTDPEVQLVRRADFHGTLVDPSSVRYAIDLPSQVNGRNPGPNWAADVMRLVREQVAHRGL